MAFNKVLGKLRREVPRAEELAKDFQYRVNVWLQGLESHRNIFPNQPKWFQIGNPLAWNFYSAKIF